MLCLRLENSLSWPRKFLAFLKRHFSHGNTLELQEDTALAYTCCNNSTPMLACHLLLHS